MNLTRDRVHSIGWISVLLVCGAATLALTLRVNAVKSEVHSTENHIVRVQQSINFLETEFQTRSNQQALNQLNDLEFGYKAPSAAQYIEGERQLAALGKPMGPGAPQPIRYANAEQGSSEESAEKEGTGLLAMVSPVDPAHAATPSRSGAGAKSRDPEREEMLRDASDLGKRLARIEVAEASQQ